MIVEQFDMRELGDGMVGFRTFEFSLSKKPAKERQHRHTLGLAASRPMPPSPVSDGVPLYGGDPQADWVGDNGKSFCSLYALCRAAGCSDTGFAHDRVADGTLKKPDATLRGIEHWQAGDSANAAASTLKSSFAQFEVAKKSPSGSVGQLGKSL